MTLEDYRVRVLDESVGTGAVVRVLIDTSNGERDWTTVGVSENIIEASWIALVDSIEYKLFKDEGKKSAPGKTRPVLAASVAAAHCPRTCFCMLSFGAC
jgi:hypothetical protein